MDNPLEDLQKKFSQENQTKFIIEQTGLDAWAVEKLGNYGLPKSVSEELEFVFNKFKSPGQVELLTSMHEERIKFLESNPEGRPWEIAEHEDHVRMIASETGLEKEDIDIYYLALIGWLRLVTKEAQKIINQKAKEG